MAGMPDVQQWAETPGADRCLPAAVPDARRGDRMARFAADSRLARLLVLGGMIAAGWLLGMIFGVLGMASTAHAETLSSSFPVAAGSALSDGFPTASDSPLARGLLKAQAGSLSPAEVTAQAMAGRNVDGLTSQSKPVLPAPSTADHSAGSNGLTPQGGVGSILFGEIARSVFDPRLLVASAPTAAITPPVVRTAADDPSFSPD
ncbi:hypothetical protein J5X84_37575 [Streptosporangiaceae bacterium NEAU-GS5]|nr:hypothetical protein [Streptosporangiaceae bacterium NEAU-GS5]